MRTSAMVREQWKEDNKRALVEGHWHEDVGGRATARACQQEGVGKRNIGIRALALGRQY